MPSQDDRMISDGTAPIVEGVRGGLYHGVHRQSPPPGPYRSLCCYVLALSGLGHPPLMGEHEPLSAAAARWRYSGPNATLTAITWGYYFRLSFEDYARCRLAPNH
jgi:hypothetical protein